MALISQIISSSYNAVLADQRKPTNQWAQNSWLAALESAGCVKTIPGGPQIEVPLDYRRNPGAAFLVNDLDPMAMGKTDVVTSAVYDWAQASVPVVWSKGDDAKNPEENQKIDFIKNLLPNAFDSHDEIVETALGAATATNGFLPLRSLVSDAGTGTIGGIVSNTDTWWRNIGGTFALSGVDLVSKLTLAQNQAAKGSGGLAPNFYLTDATTHATFEGTQGSLQRYVGNDAYDAGRKEIAFKQGKMSFGQFATGQRIYGLNAKTFKLLFAKGAKRQKGDTQEIDNGNGYRFFIYTMLQAVVSARSRLFVIVGS